ncbi:MAG: ferrous iron transport protein A [Magnetococcales bacterium]|nr:ferrous iron transport protein A [Magnetococcales bacterium]
MKTLKELKLGETATIIGVEADTISQNRLSSMGVIKGNSITLRNKAPFGDPRIYIVMDYELTLRNQDAQMVQIEAN